MNRSHARTAYFRVGRLVGHRSAAKGIVVLFPRPRPTTNPYLLMLGNAIRSVPTASTVDFTWRQALLGHYDVAHLHWPESLLSGRTGPRALARQGLFLMFLARLRLTRRPLVRTLHNLELPSDLTRLQRGLLGLCQRQTTLWISINESTPVPPGLAHVLIPHGHYRDWFADYPRAEPVPGRVAFFGLVRRYKGVERLVEAFLEANGPEAAGLSLTISGKPSTPQMVETLVSLATADPRIQFTFRFLEDSEIVQAVTSAELVVLPYRHMHNSGGALAALSLGRPILVPRNAANIALADEVGEGWVHTFADELSASDLLRALKLARLRLRAGGQPELGQRGWEQAGARHVGAYRTALRLARRRRGRGSAH